MSTSRPRLLPITGVLFVLAFALPAAAVEYRLRVANVFDASLTSFLSPGELNDGSRGPGFQRLDDFLTQGRARRRIRRTHHPLRSVPRTLRRGRGRPAPP